MKDRCYTVFENCGSLSGRHKVFVNQTLKDVPYNVWRDVSNLAIRMEQCNGGMTFEFIGEGTLERAERILQGAMFQQQSAVSNIQEFKQKYGDGAIAFRLLVEEFIQRSPDFVTSAALETQISIMMADLESALKT